MNSKKIVAVLLAMGVITASCTLFNEKGAFAESVKQNVVYTKEDKTTDSKEKASFYLSKAENEVIKERSAEALKKFNISAETIKGLDFSSSIINNKTLIEMQAGELKMIQDEYEKKELTEEEYNKEKAEVAKHYKALKGTIEKLKHGFIQTSWMNENDVYLVFFNENTKEVEYAIGSNFKNDASEVPLALNEEQLKNIAENFIKQNKLGDLEKPKVVLIKGKHVYYQEENDPTKKVKITINPYTGKVGSYAIKAYANMFYDEMVNDK